MDGEATSVFQGGKRDLPVKNQNVARILMQEMAFKKNSFT